MGMLRWLGRLCVIKKRVQDSWMDLFPAYTIDDDRFIRDYTDLVNRRGTHIDVNQAFVEWLTRRRDAHTQSFPINDNIFALMVTVQADLSEQQRENMSAHMTMRGVQLQDYSFEKVRECMIELFCAPRSALENPSFRVNN